MRSFEKTRPPTKHHANRIANMSTLCKQADLVERSDEKKQITGYLAVVDMLATETLYALHKFPLLRDISYFAQINNSFKLCVYDCGKQRVFTLHYWDFVKVIHEKSFSCVDWCEGDLIHWSDRRAKDDIAAVERGLFRIEQRLQDSHK